MSRLTDEASPLGKQFARFMAQQAGEPMDGVLAKSAAWLVDLHAQGDVCLNLQQQAERAWPDQQGITPSYQPWRKALLSTLCVGLPEDHTPMVVDGHRLYLRRLWRDEHDVATALLARLEQTLPCNDARLQQGLQRLFPLSSDEPQTTDWQKVAASMAVCRCFSVISGGPGTGKTRSLVRILTLLLEQNPDTRIGLAAPTGKAAARMMEAIGAAKQSLNSDDTIRSLIPEQASTLHRLLGYSPRGWRHDANNPLLMDCLVVDEASMIDLAMMARLLRALPTTTRLILLGDRDQLASVDAGSVLGDITGHNHPIIYDTATRQRLSALSGTPLTTEQGQSPPIANAITLLRKSYRFGEASTVGCVARAVNRGAAEEVIQLLNSNRDGTLTWWQEHHPHKAIAEATQLYQPYLNQPHPKAALAAFASFRVLCALRQGELGVEKINQAIANLLNVSYHGHGMPIMITANHYDLGLFNGDTGLLWQHDDGSIHAYIRQTDQSLRAIPLPLLPTYEAAWAMTVHKAQGSEFDQVMLLLPPTGGEAIITRELLYTAITRARHRCTLYSHPTTLAQAVRHCVQRSSGLATRLGWS